MKVIDIKQKFEMAAVGIRVQLIAVLFLSTNYLVLDWSLLSIKIYALVTIVLMAIIGDCLGFAAFAFYLVKIGKSGEVDRWARHSEFSVPWRNYTKNVLNKYANNNDK